MTTLSPESDRSVRHAVDAYLDGAIRPELGHDTRFETRNGHYRLVGGVLFHVVRGVVSDVSHVGAELVGWLWEGHNGSRVEMSWRHGARGILVNRRRGRHIVITSATRNLVCEMLAGSQPPQNGSTAHHHGGSAHALATAGTMPDNGYVPRAAGVPKDTGGYGPLPYREPAAPARWSTLSPATPAQPIRSASPVPPAPGMVSWVEAHLPRAPMVPDVNQAGVAAPAIPSASPYQSTLPVPARSAPLASAPAASGFAPDRGPAGTLLRLEDAERVKDAEGDVPPSTPVAGQPFSARRPTNAHVQRGLVLR